MVHVGHDGASGVVNVEEDGWHPVGREDFSEEQCCRYFSPAFFVATA